MSLNRRVGRSKLVIIERDLDALKKGYLEKLYIVTFKKGLLPYYIPSYIFM